MARGSHGALGQGKGYCKVCGRRPPRYYRSYSGDPLCAHCLKRVLARALRRFLASSRLLRRRDRLLVVVNYLDLPLAPAIVELLTEVEGKYSSQVSVAVVMGGGPMVASCTRLVAEAASDVIIVESIPEAKMVSINPLAAFRLERALGVKVAKEAGYRVLVHAATATSTLLLALEAILRGAWEEVPLFVEDYQEAVHGLVITNPFKVIEAEALAAYAILRGVYCDEDLPTPASMLMSSRVLKLLEPRGPELAFSYHKALSALAEGLGKAGIVRCMECSSFTYSAGVCEYCAHLSSALLKIVPRPR